MFYQVLPNYIVRIENPVLTISGIRPMEVDKPVEFQLTISNGEKSVDKLRLHAATLTRDQLLKLKAEIDSALVLTPATPEEVRNHNDHKAWQVEKERGW